MESPYEEFGSLVFGEKEMLERLPKPIYMQWKRTLADEGTLDRTTADSIAHAMKRWALEKGATHYTHWFQPLTGTTAEKHDAFIEPYLDGQPFTRFSGKTLIKGEPDASSFPSGGLRATFEARGYTYWDVTSPAFIKDNVLCIPTVFVSYNGESLDKKDPLLKSIKAVNTAATRVVNLLGEKNVKSCIVNVGLEQEYFLVDKKYFDSRLDLKFTGRTLFGCSAPKGQELDDHYFGAIPPRVYEFMKEVNQELWKLGIYAKTEHNEAAPGQFELAPVFSNCNVAVDNNQITMDILRKTAEKHGFACLLHEKPFNGINGSGKHNNWSLSTDDGQVLFSPGDKPAENIRFLTFICAFIKAVDNNAKLLRMSASCAGNDHRLGANEAPPAIISIYLGDFIERILMDLAKNTTTSIKEDSKEFNPITGLSYIPHDNTDRNRTSPVAFTGNKFEFRMLGSSMSASFSNVVLNSIMADSLNEIAEQLDGIKYLQDVRAKALQICKDIILKHNRILFSGDGYSEEWVKEAERRNLPNIKSTIESFDILEDPSTVKMLTSLGVYNETELRARKAIYTEQYIKTIGIEVKTLLAMVNQHIIPAVTADLKFYAEANQLTHTRFLENRCNTLQVLLDTISEKSEKLSEDYASILTLSSARETGIKMYYELCPDMISLRSYIDQYEKIANPENYKLPTYQQMLFTF